MTTFSSALKTNISNYGFKTAMVQTWKQVRAGKVERPPRRKKGARKIRKVNPKIKTSKGIFYFPTFNEARKYAQDNNYPTDRIIEYQKGWAIQLRVSGPYVGLEWQMSGIRKSKNPKKARRKNPIIIYNPRNPKLIYGKATISEIRGTKTNGPLKGKHFKHKFNSEVSIYGLPNGAILIKPLSGQRLWANESDVDKYDKT